MSQAVENPVEAGVWEALKKVVDPEVGINIVDLGLVYKVEVVGHRAQIEITMTSPSCPLSAVIVDEARLAVLRENRSLSGVMVQLVWDPPWTPERMSEAARNILGQS